MAEKSFKYKVVVNVQGAAGLSSLESQLKRVTNGFAAVNKAQKDTAGGLSKLFLGTNNQLAGMIDNVKKLGLALLAIKAIGMGLNAAFDFGKKIVEAARFRQTTVSALDRFFPDRGKSIFADTIKLANRTPADTKPLLEFEQQLSGVGVSEEALKKLTLLRADVEAGGAGQSSIDSMATVFSAAAGGAAPEVGADYIQKFLGKTNWVRALASQLGVKDAATANVATLEKTILDAKKNGKLAGNEYTNALVQATNDRLKQSKIGEISKSMTEGSVAGAISNFSNVMDNMLLSVDLDKMPGIKAFVKLLNQITEILSSDQFQSGLEDIINSLFGGFEELVKNPERIKAGMAGLLETAKGIASALGAAFSWLARIATAGSAKDALLEVVDGLANVLMYIGELIGKGIKAAIWGGPSMYDERSQEAARKAEVAAVEEANKNQRQLTVSTALDDAAGTSSLDSSNGFGFGVNGGIPIHTTVVVQGSIDKDGIDKIHKAAESGTGAALDKASAKHQLRKAGKGK